MKLLQSVQTPLSAGVPPLPAAGVSPAPAAAVPSTPAAPQPAPTIAAALAETDAAETAILRGRDDVASIRAAAPKGIATALAGVAAGAATLLTLAGSPLAAPLVVTAGVVVIAGAVVAGSTISERRQAEAALREQEQRVVSLRQQIDAACALGRAANEQSLLKASRDGVAVIRHVDSDPYVVVAEDRYAHAARVVERDHAMLAMSPRERFAADMPRAEEVLLDRADALGLFGLLGCVGTAWVGFSLGAALELPAVLLGGLGVAAAEWILQRHFGARMVAPGVDRQLRHEIQAEVACHEPQLDALRTARDAAQQSALAHYAGLLENLPAQPAGTVSVEDGHVVIGGVSVPRVDTPSDHRHGKGEH